MKSVDDIQRLVIGCRDTKSNEIDQTNRASDDSKEFRGSCPNDTPSQTIQIPLQADDIGYSGNVLIQRSDGGIFILSFDCRLRFVELDVLHAEQKTPNSDASESRTLHGGI